MKILFNLPTIHDNKVDLSPFNQYPLGLLSITNYLLDRIPDLQIKTIVGQVSLEELIEYKPDLIGISVLSPFFTVASDFIRRIQEKMPLVPIIIGGHHITYIPTLLPKECAVGVLGEGEQSCFELVSLLLRKERLFPDDLASIQGIVYWDNGELKNTGKRTTLLSENEFPIIRRYETCEFKTQKPIQFHIMTSRGCPHRCRFCSSSPFWGKIRYYSAEQTVEQVSYLVDTFHPNLIHIFDDLMVTNLPRLKNIHDLVIDKKLHKKTEFECWVSGDSFNNETSRLLKEINVKTVSFAIESASPEIYKYLKGTWNSPELNKRGIITAHKMGMRVSIAAIVGSPAETVDDMEITYQYIKKLPIDGGLISLLKPFPGTPLWAEAKQKGIVNDQMPDWIQIEHNDLRNPDALFMGERSSREQTLEYYLKIGSLLQRKASISRWKNRLLKLYKPRTILRYTRRLFGLR